MKTLQTTYQRISEWIPSTSIGYFSRSYLLHCKTPPNISIPDHLPLSTHYIPYANMLARSRLVANLLRISGALLCGSNIFTEWHVSLSVFTLTLNEYSVWILVINIETLLFFFSAWRFLTGNRMSKPLCSLFLVSYIFSFRILVILSSHTKHLTEFWDRRLLQESGLWC